ncbi:acyltransferase [Motilimonas pumila]|uniref:Acyltransferase n=1 Tax=Motilimonas pumila TaxID=2303987 RepID=A0A418YD73_9GAMM|nr:acyltransferase [Motilimonas pumila]RJG42429.1 acyltransferase [Motilimonas pumila]
MADYQNIYLTRPDQSLSQSVNQQLSDFGCQLGLDNAICGVPRVAYTQISDDTDNAAPINAHDFSGCISIGDNCYIESTCSPAFHSQAVKMTSVKRNQYPAGKITIGNHVQLQGTAILAYEQVTVQDNVIFGPMVTIMDCSGHTLTQRGQAGEIAALTTAPVTIKAHAWIGANVMILKGVTIGEHAVVGAGSVVYQDIPDHCVALGNPAKVVKDIHPEQLKAVS